MTATTTTSTWQPSHDRSHSRTSRPSTTPKAHPVPMSVGQAMPPPRPSPPTRSPQPRKTIRSPSPSYFGLAVNDEVVPSESNPGLHVKQNWNYASSSKGSVAATPRAESQETNQPFAAFRKQSQSYGFSLNSNVAGVRNSSLSGQATPVIPRSNDSPVSTSTQNPSIKKSDSTDEHAGKRSGIEPSFFDIARRDSPLSLSPMQHTVADQQQARLSLPTSELRGPISGIKKEQRSETLPPTTNSVLSNLSTAQNVADILEAQSSDVLLLDLRVFPQYATSRIRGALNLCIPTTLLKRPTFTVQKLADTFTSDSDKKDFAKWETSKYIIVYDANSNLAQEAVVPFNVLKKFTTLGWKGQGLVIKGGFLQFSRMFPDLVENGAIGQGPATQAAAVSAPNQGILPVAGGCSMPTSDSAANPFFGNIRQNMDLLDGVGQIPIQKPTLMSDRDEKTLPVWLRKAAGPADEGKQVSDKFLKIERGEQKRMQQALSGNVQYGTPARETPDRIQVAGIEKGSKNRYNNIFPFDHSRVKLQGVPSDGCDYVNANYVQAGYTNRKYIATQAPIPTTFGDFWRVVWEQDVQVIVMLTAEKEGGQVKSHSYWDSGDYGQIKLQKLSERKVSLDKAKTGAGTPARPSLGSRRSTQPHTTSERKVPKGQLASVEQETPSVTVRHFTLSHSAHPFQSMKEVTQLQYTQWPDFGAPASPTAILGLIDMVNKYLRPSALGGRSTHEVAPPSQKPILVHCSAGCGRTGTFCTVDSVIDMLKRQRLERQTQASDGMEVDTPDDWVLRDDIDLVAKAVDDFRHQRLSMVQNLRQFVLCYESIIQWIMLEEHNDVDRAKEMRMRSYDDSRN